MNAILAATRFPKLKMKHAIRIAAAFLLAAISSSHAADPAATKPNIILFVADDLGYRDLSCFGSPAVKTPHIDKIAAGGTKLTHFYTAGAVCSPTRASILTGRYPARIGILQHFNDRDGFVPTTIPTVAKMLRDAGYATAHVGKWHLGGLHVENGVRVDTQPGPRQHGFDDYQCQIEQQPLRGKMGREKTLYRKGGTVLLHNDKQLGEDSPHFTKHLTDAQGDSAIEFIKGYAAAGKPFFLNLWWLVPHTPFEPAPEPHWSATAAPGISESQHCFRSMVQHMDAKVGQIMRTLEELKLADNTLIIFTSDNGAASEGDIGTLSGGKGMLYEGGVRVPFIASWPGRIPAGKELRQFGISTDILPTLCAAAGVPPSKELPLDGRNLLPTLTGGAEISWEQRGTVFWAMNVLGLQRRGPKPTPGATSVARKDQWKLMMLGEKPVALFDVMKDPDEKANVLADQPNVVKALEGELTTWLKANPAQPRLGGKGKEASEE
jgi:N-acetylgalactosamine-6-sulfatase